MKKLLPITAALTLLAGTGTATAEDGLVYVPVEPCRIADTRKSVQGEIVKNGARQFLVAGSQSDLADQGGQDCPNPLADDGLEPVAVAAYYVAVPAPSSSGNGILAAYPSDQPKPAPGTGATLNFAQGEVIGNTSITTLCNGNVKDCPNGGPLAILMRDTAEHVVVDVQGYFFPPTTGIPGYQIVEASRTVAESRAFEVSVNCPNGKQAIGGGGFVTNDGDDWFMTGSAPLPDGSGWAAVFRSAGNFFRATGTARAICAD